MLISRTHNFIYIHIPKTAGSSMTAALRPYLLQKTRKKVGQFGWQPPLHFERSLHCGAGDKKGWRILQRHPKHFVFSIVRNPWDRFASLARAHKVGDGCSIPELYERFMCRMNPAIVRRDWVYPQTWRLYNDDLPEPSFVARFERIDEDWKILCGALGIDHKEYPKTNVGNGPEDWRDAYEDCRDYIPLVGELYKTDCKKFGYTFE